MVAYLCHFVFSLCRGGIPIPVLSEIKKKRRKRNSDTKRRRLSLFCAEKKISSGVLHSEAKYFASLIRTFIFSLFRYLTFVFSLFRGAKLCLFAFVIFAFLISPRHNEKKKLSNQPPYLVISRCWHHALLDTFIVCWTTIISM